jgi:hypothetical protein
MKHEVYVVGSSFTDYFHVIKNHKFKKWIGVGGISNITNFPNVATDYNSAYYLLSDVVAPVTCATWAEKNQTKEVEKFFENKIVTTDWIHFMYANTIPDLDISKFKSKYKSCDLSNGPNPTISLESTLQNVEACDIVFMSCHHEHFEKVKKASDKKILICHSENGSLLFQRGKLTFKYYHAKEDFVFVTGAGDKFAGNFIENYLVQNLPFEESIELSHEKVLTWLREENQNLCK